MTETAHTQGEWLCVDNGDDSLDYDVLSITTEDRVYRSLVDIARVSVGYDEPLEAEQRANAKLIAAAPDMLAALKLCAYRLEMDRQEILVLLDDDSPDDGQHYADEADRQAVALANAAIAKASL